MEEPISALHMGQDFDPRFTHCSRQAVWNWCLSSQVITTISSRTSKSLQQI